MSTYTLNALSHHQKIYDFNSLLVILKVILNILFCYHTFFHLPLLVINSFT